MQSSKKMHFKFNKFFQKYFVIISALSVLEAMNIFKLSTCFEFVFFSKHKIKKTKRVIRRTKRQYHGNKTSLTLDCEEMNSRFVKSERKLERFLNEKLMKFLPCLF